MFGIQISSHPEGDFHVIHGGVGLANPNRGRVLAFINRDHTLHYTYFIDNPYVERVYH